jgi:hypothetical protein
MKNIVTASIQFSFKGKVHSPSITLELDLYLAGGNSLPDLYPLIAKANNHDIYSYEYEMMQAEEIIFSDAKGLVSEFIVAGKLDTVAFEKAWNENKNLEKLRLIAQKYLGINDFSRHDDLKQALLASYQLGKKENNPD